MLTSSEILAAKLVQAMDEREISSAALAKAIGATKQAVYSWRKTGRIDKKHLQALATITGKPLAWWLEQESSTNYQTAAPVPLQTHRATNSAPAPYRAQQWPFLEVSESEYNALLPTQKAQVEGFVKGLLAESGRTKSNQAA